MSQFVELSDYCLIRADLIQQIQIQDGKVRVDHVVGDSNAITWIHAPQGASIETVFGIIRNRVMSPTK